MTITLIAAVALSNRVIGAANALPWASKQHNDMQHFKGLTWGKTVVMGRKTFESMASKPLKSRTCIVLTSMPFPTQCTQDASSGSARSATAAHVLDWYKDSEEEVFVIGGAQVYEFFMPHADRLVITCLDDLHAPVEGDALFPVIDESKWRLVSEEVFGKDAYNLYDYTYETYVRQP
jgi:dihydrofolate reductase